MLCSIREQEWVGSGSEGLGVGLRADSNSLHDSAPEQMLGQKVGLEPT